MNEYEERLTKAYAAKTYDELDRLSADLPGAMTTDPQGRPVPPGAVDAAAGHHERVRAPRPVERAEAS